jgi:hypothetical protein
MAEAFRPLGALASGAGASGRWALVGGWPAGAPGCPGRARRILLLRVSRNTTRRLVSVERGQRRAFLGTPATRLDCSRRGGSEQVGTGPERRRRQEEHKVARCGAGGKLAWRRGLVCVAGASAASFGWLVRAVGPGWSLRRPCHAWALRAALWAASWASATGWEKQRGDALGENAGRVCGGAGGWAAEH